MKGELLTKSSRVLRYSAAVISFPACTSVLVNFRKSNLSVLLQTLQSTPPPSSIQQLLQELLIPVILRTSGRISSSDYGEPDDPLQFSSYGFMLKTQQQNFELDHLRGGEGPSGSSPSPPLLLENKNSVISAPPQELLKHSGCSYLFLFAFRPPEPSRTAR